MYQKLSLVIGFLLVVVGCSSPGIFVSRQAGNSVPKIGVAPVDGTYGLYIAGESQSLYEVPMKQGQPLGFERGDDGVVRWMYAVAGNSRNRLDITQTYEWRRQP